MLSNSRGALIALALTALLSSSCAGAPDKETYGAIYPTEGTQGVGGREEYEGVKLAAELAGVKLDLEVTEQAVDVTAAVAKLHKRGREVVLGSYGSTISAAASIALHDRGMFFWETGAVGEISHQGGLHETTFRAISEGSVLGRRAIEFVDEVVHPLLTFDKTFAVVYVDDVYGRSVARGAIDSLGARVVTEIPYRLDTVNYEAVAAQIKQAAPGSLFVVAYLKDGVALQEELHRQDALPTVAIGTSSAYCMKEFGKLLGDKAVGLFASDKPNAMIAESDELSDDAQQALQWADKQYRSRFDEPMTAAALTGFASAWALFSKVAPSAKSFDAESFSLAARDIHLKPGSLPNGSGLSFTDGSNTQGESVIWEWVAPNQREIVWPKKFATHDVFVASESDTSSP